MNWTIEVSSWGDICTKIRSLRFTGLRDRLSTDPATSGLEVQAGELLKLSCTQHKIWTLFDMRRKPPFSTPCLRVEPSGRDLDLWSYTKKKKKKEFILRPTKHEVKNKSACSACRPFESIKRGRLRNKRDPSHWIRKTAARLLHRLFILMHGRHF